MSEEASWRSEIFHKRASYVLLGSQLLGAELVDNNTYKIHKNIHFGGFSGLKRP